MIIPTYQQLIYCRQFGGMPNFQRPCQGPLENYGTRVQGIPYQKANALNSYYPIKHSARMMNMIPDKYCGKLASPFMLVHGVHPDPRTWLPLFLVCYFHHKNDSNASRSKLQAHTMDGIILDQSSTSNAIHVYNQCNWRY